MENKLKKCIEKLSIYGNNRQYIICPFGYYGRMVKDELNSKGIKESFILDSNGGEGVTTVDELDKLVVDDDCTFIIASINNEIQDFYNNKILEVYPNAYIINVFDSFLSYSEGFAKFIATKKDFNFEEKIYQMEMQKAKFYLPLYDVDVIQKHIISTGTFFDEEMLYWIVKDFKDGIIGKKIKGGCVLDIGANIGNHSLYFSILCGAKNVYAFEPIVSTYETLVKNIDINEISDIVCAYNVAVGAKAGWGKSGPVNRRNTGGTNIKEVNDSDMKELEIVSIDSLQLDACDFMKIDVEGFEKNVIDGAIATIEKFRPYIMLESFDEIGNIHYIMNVLVGLGYKWIQYTGQDYLFFQ